MPSFFFTLISLEQIVTSEGNSGNIRLSISYDGTLYSGWQRQKNKPTVQGIIEKKIEFMSKKPASLTASGRTDAGVHALNQVANFRIDSSITPQIFKKGLNSLLPDDILIKQAEYVPLDFHARYNAKSKIYQYIILNKQSLSPFLKNYVWHVPSSLNVQAIENCLNIIKGTHDFSAFSSAKTSGTNFVREMIAAELKIRNNNLLSLTFKANGFLRYMVRNLTGTIVKVASGHISMDLFEKILMSKDRQHPGVKAPPNGLFLTRVNY